MDTINSYLHIVDPSTDVLALQEVSGIKQWDDTSEDTQKSLHELTFDEGEISGQVILIAREAADCVCKTFRGKVIGVQYRDSQRCVRWVFSVHLPHQGSDDAVFQQGLHEISSVCHEHQSEEVVLIGDWNVDWGSDRAILVEGVLSNYGFQIQRPDQNTRFGHHTSSCLDFVAISQPIASKLLPNQTKTCAIVNSRLELGSDHERITVELIFGQRDPVWKRTQRKPHPMKG